MKGVTKSSIPPEFDTAFLDWFRDRSEAVWASLPVQTPEEILAEFVERDVAGNVWQSGTRWLGGLDAEEIAKAEERWNLRFPPDYRLFLERLHAPDRPALRTAWVSKSEKLKADDVLARAKYDRDDDMVLGEGGSSLYNWSTDDEALQTMFEWPVRGLYGIWQPSWGPEPADLDEQKRRLREVAKTAPKLIPVYGHRYLLGEPVAAGNPVLSIYGSDIIILAADLHDYFLVEFADDLLGMTFKHEEKLHRSAERRIAKSYDRYTAIPFWGEFL
jgi:hypothetical protein